MKNDMYHVLLFLAITTNLHATTVKPTKSHVPDNPFGPNVIIFDPTMNPADINQKIATIYNQQQFNEFGTQRYALLFAKGSYGQNIPIDVRVGYYTEVAGIGKKPDDVVIRGAVRTQDRPGGPGATMNFWRSMENLAVVPVLGGIVDGSIPKDQNVWACSQGCPVRRTHIKAGSLRLWDQSWSSGGLVADTVVDISILSGTQQQFLTRNSRFNNWEGKNWNIVFVGNFGAIPGGQWPNPPYTIIEKTPLIKEKPYLYFDTAQNTWFVSLRTRRRNVAGTDWHIEGTPVPLSAFYLAKQTDNAAILNAALDSGKHLLFPPGVYNLSEPIRVKRPGTILFGMGFATLTATNGNEVINIEDVDSVQVAGFNIDAGPTNSSTLLKVGNSVNSKTHIDPIFLYDIFCRVGGVNHPSVAQTCMTINSNDTVADNLWLWRADHGSNVGWNINKSDSGLVVNGKNVIVYNLMAEHHEKYQVLWNGEAGQVYEFQAEPPYDVPNQQAWMDGNIRGYAAYKIADTVVNHRVEALGIYTNFQNCNIWMDSGILAPATASMRVNHMIAFWLNGCNDSGMVHIINNVGCGVNPQNRLCQFDHFP